MEFATITIIVLDTLRQADAWNIIPLLSLKVGVSFNSDSITSTIYPCVIKYSGANQIAIDAMLLAQKNCALQDPICSAQGPVPIGPGGSIQFTLLLDDETWTAAQLDDDTLTFRNSIFIDFMVVNFNASGKKLITNLQTSTVLKRISVNGLCMDEQVETSKAEILSGNIFLGLVGEDDLFNASLVQNLDVTQRQQPATCAVISH